MKRALAVLLVFGVAAFAQFPAFTGKWEAKFCYPPLGLTSTLSLATNISGFDITTVMGFGLTGLVDFKVSYKGALGPFSLKGNMWFDPDAPAYSASDLITSLDFAGVALGLTIRHWMPNKFRYKEWYPDTNPCPVDKIGMSYILTAKVDPFSVKVYFTDCCEGIYFDKAVLTLKGIGLCCGIALDAKLSFSKVKGFEYLELSGIEIPLCCGVSMTAKVKFTVDAKIVTTGLKFAGFADACFTVYGDAIGYPATNPKQWLGIEIYGWKIKCALGDCNYVEFLHALNVTEIEKILGDIFLEDCGEFEYMKLGFCGPGCCGGQYKVDLGIYFGSQGGLFDITRLVYNVKIPIMSNFTFDVSGTVAAASCATTSICFGWTFTF